MYVFNVVLVYVFIRGSIFVGFFFVVGLGSLGVFLSREGWDFVCCFGNLGSWSIRE